MIDTVFPGTTTLLALFSLLLRLIAMWGRSGIMFGLIVVLFEFTLGQRLLKLWSAHTHAHMQKQKSFGIK